MIKDSSRTMLASIGAFVMMAGGLGLVAGPALGATTAPIPVGTPPIAVITTPRTVYAGIPITLSGAKSTTAGGAISEWEWDLNGDGGFERDSTSSPWVSRSFKSGTHTVVLRVRNESGLVSTAMKTLTVRKPKSATVKPAAPVAVGAVVQGTGIAVTWQEPLGARAVTYRVANVSDLNTDPIYVPATERLEATFAGLIPGTYKIRVTGVNSLGAGPAAETEATVATRAGSSPSPTASNNAPSPTANPTSIKSGAPSTPAASRTSAGGSNRSTIGIALVGVGVVVLLGAGGTAIVSARKRRT